MTNEQLKAGLLWLSDADNNPRVGDILTHGNTIAALRDMGLARRVRIGHVAKTTVLTAKGRSRLLALVGGKADV